MKVARCFTPILFGLVACGSLAADPNRKPSLATVTGELVNPKAVRTSSNVRIAVLWRDATFDRFISAVDLPVQPVFPSKFRIELTDPPPSEALGDPFSDATEPRSTEGHPPPLPSNGPSSGGPMGIPGPRTDAGGPSCAPTCPSGPRVDAGGPIGSPGSTGTGPIVDAGVVHPLRPFLGTLGARDKQPSGLRAAVGVVVAYEDLNGNGKLDLVDRDATAFVDRVVGTNENVVITYFEGVIPDKRVLRDDSGHLPTLGYNLYRDGDSCGGGVTKETLPGMPAPSGPSGPSLPPLPPSTDSGTDGSSGTPSPQPPPRRPDAGTPLGADLSTMGASGSGVPSGDAASCKSAWLPMSTLYELILANDSRFGRLMCTNGVSEEGIEATGGSRGAQNGRPATYPKPSDPKLRCYKGASADGVDSYYVFGSSECTTVSQGPCRGSITTCKTPEIWNRPTPVPADWPCKD
jgi:hypothetical protein